MTKFRQKKNIAFANSRRFHKDHHSIYLLPFSSKYLLWMKCGHCWMSFIHLSDNEQGWVIFLCIEWKMITEELLHEYFNFILINILNVGFMIYVGGGNWMSSMNIHTSISLHKCLMLYPWIWFIIWMMLKEFLISVTMTNKPFHPKSLFKVNDGCQTLGHRTLETCQYLFVHTCWNVLNLVLTNVINKLLTHCQRHHV
jgi:hypothetical protein